jgi:hypothetical protein
MLERNFMETIKIACMLFEINDCASCPEKLVVSHIVTECPVLM